MVSTDSIEIARIAEKEQGVKTSSAQQKYAGLKKELKDYLKTNAVALRSMFSLYVDLLTMKNMFVKKLNEAQGISTFIETPEGFKVTDRIGSKFVSFHQNI